MKPSYCCCQRVHSAVVFEQVNDMSSDPVIVLNHSTVPIVCTGLNEPVEISVSPFQFPLKHSKVYSRIFVYCSPCPPMYNFGCKIKPLVCLNMSSWFLVLFHSLFS